MSAVYWALMGMALMGRDLETEMKLSEIVEWVLQCQHPNGGYVLLLAFPPSLPPSFLPSFYLERGE